MMSTERKHKALEFAVSMAFLLALTDLIWEWCGSLNLVLLIILGTALLAPGILRKPAELFTDAVKALGVLGSGVLLSLLYFLILTPIALLRRLIGQAPLDLAFTNQPSYWRHREERASDRSDLERPF